MSLAIIKLQIAQKQLSTPHFGTSNEAIKIITDFDHFPYTRFYRGSTTFQDPIVIEREAGWRFRRDTCYIPKNCPQPVLYPNHLFENACSTTLPSNSPPVISKPSDDCIVQYR